MARRGRPGTSPGGRDPRPRGRSAKDRSTSTDAAPGTTGTDAASASVSPEPSDRARDAVVGGKAAPRRVGPRMPKMPERTFFGLSTGRAVVLAIVVCALALTLAVPLRTYFTQRAELEQVLGERQGLEDTVRDLELQKTQLNEPARIAAQARERLRFVMPGETPYQVQLPGDYSKAVEARTPQVQSAGPWYRDLWESAVQPQESDEPDTAPLPVLVPAPAPAIEGGPVG